MTETKGTNKQRIIYLLDILKKNTDEAHGLTMTEIFDELYLRNITAERKAIYNDIEILRSAGYNIEKRHGNTVTYHLVSNLFTTKSISDISLIIATSPFLSKEKSRALTIAVNEEATKENRTATAIELLKLMPEYGSDCTDTIALLLKGAAEKKKVNVTVNGNTVRISVYAVCMAENVPYVIYGRLGNKKKIDHIKVSALDNVEITDIQSIPLEECTDIEGLDLQEYADTYINIKPDRKYDVNVIVDESLIISFIEGFIGDRLEGDAKTSRVDDYRFRVKMKSIISKELVKFLYKNSSMILMQTIRI
jgi:hypothetical protein